MTAQIVKLDNPYWKIVQTFPDSKFKWGTSNFEPDSYPDLMEYVRTPAPQRTAVMQENAVRRTRSTLVSEYAWAIPSNRTIRWLAEQIGDRGVVEIGAGTGYWAYLLNQMGVDIVCYDETLLAQGDENNWFKGTTTTFHPIFRGDASTAARYTDRMLFLCWPPYGSSLAIDAVLAHQGEYVIFEGEGEGGCCADDDFFQHMESDFEIVAEHRPIQWSGIHDWLTIYRRKTHIIKEDA